MSNEYFEFFKNISYKGNKIRDISRRVKIVETLEENPYLFLPYTVQHDEKPEDIAYDYYGDPHLVWLVYLANGIVNPYEDWVMDSTRFQKFLIAKYKTASGKTGHEVIQWCHSNIEFYINDNQDRITNDTYEISPTLIRDDWSPVTTYDFEEWKNESKRNIRLVNLSLKDKAIEEFRKQMNV